MSGLSEFLKKDISFKRKPSTTTETKTPEAETPKAESKAPKGEAAKPPAAEATAAKQEKTPEKAQKKSTRSLSLPKRAPSSRENESLAITTRASITT